MDARSLSDRELLALEFETLWNRDSDGRLVQASLFNNAPAPDVALAVSSGRPIVAFGSDVQDDLAREIVELVARSGASATSLLVDGARVLLTQSLGPIDVHGGPSYAFERVSAASAVPGILHGEDPAAAELKPPPEAHWTDREWEALLGGKLGPWAAAVVDGGVASLCFCARLTNGAAEAGLRTEEPFRRRGYGAAVTAAWASQVTATGRVAFYSTSSDNTASQAVAARLGLRPIGWTCQFSALT